MKEKLDWHLFFCYVLGSIAVLFSLVANGYAVYWAVTHPKVLLVIVLAGAVLGIFLALFCRKSFFVCDEFIDDNWV